MPALTAANVTVAITDRKIFTKQRRHAVTITYGDGALTYPAGGVPLPAFANFGFSRYLTSLNIRDPASANGYIYKYDEANNKIRIYQGDNTNAAAAPAVEIGTGVAPAATSLRAEAIGW